MANNAVRQATQPTSGDPDARYPYDSDVIRQLAELREMTVAELREKHRELYGFETRSRHKQQLFKRLAWRVQELRYGGLSDWAEERLDEIADSIEPFDARFLPPRKDQGGRQTIRFAPKQGSKTIAPGTVLVREYKGEEHEVTALQQGFEYRGKVFRSLSGIAREITGTQWNGRRFFGLVDAKGGSR